MNFIKHNWFKLGIIIAILILAGGYISYLNQKNHLAELERFDRIDKETQERIAKEKLQKQEHVSSQKKSCLAIYESEGKKWNNVSGWNYLEEEDQCQIVYKEGNPKTKLQCQKDFDETVAYDPKDSSLRVRAFIEKLKCDDGIFYKTF